MSSRCLSRSRFAGVVALAGVVGLTACGSASAQSGAASVEEHAEEAPELHGVLLGEFFFRGVRGAEGIKVRLSFSLYASVSEEHEDDFEGLLEKRRHRVREQVLTAIRLTETSDLQEPDLARLKRRILMRLRRTSPELVIQQLHFREFTLLFD